jgi:predicted TIM-barrel fold metal-dependent hydrolase
MKIIDAQVHIWSKTVTPPSGLHRKVASFTAEDGPRSLRMDRLGLQVLKRHG